MKRIVLEVDEQAGKAYKNLSVEKQQQLLQTVNMLLKKISNDATATEYRKLLDEFGSIAMNNGLSQGLLDSLMSKND